MGKAPVCEAAARRPASERPTLATISGLPACGRLVGDGAEAGSIANTFEIGEEDVGAAGVEQPIDVIMRFEAGLVAGAGLIGEAQLPRPAAAQEGEGQRAALAADRDRPAFAAFGKQALRRIVEYRAEGRHQRFQRVDEALRIGPADDDAEALDDRAQAPRRAPAPPRSCSSAKPELITTAAGMPLRPHCSSVGTT